MKTQEPRRRRRHRKCKCCGELYMPDARHLRDQHYCTRPACRAASKKASQQHWLHSEKGSEYRDPEEGKRRVRDWRAANPGYWRRTGRRRPVVLQETIASEPVDGKALEISLASGALQDSFFLQPALVVGLIASLTGSALQETIATASRRFVLLGQDILGMGPGSPPGDYRYANRETHPVSGTTPSHS